MGMNKIIEELRVQVQQWHQRITHKRVKPTAIHPSSKILDLLDQIYWLEIPRDLRMICERLIAEVESVVPKWPSLEYGDDYKLLVLGYINSFTNLLIEPGPQGEWSKPMTKLAIMNALGIDSYKKFRTYGRVHPIRNAGSTKMWQINLDGLNETQTEKLLKA